MYGMHGRMQKTAAGTWAVAVSALFLSLAAAPVFAQEPSPVLILDPIKDFGSDPDSDGLYEYLVLRVPLIVEKADVYNIGAQVFVRDSETPLARAGQTVFLDAGEQAVKLTFGAQALVPLPAGQQLSFRISQHHVRIAKPHDKECGTERHPEPSGQGNRHPALA